MSAVITMSPVRARSAIQSSATSNPPLTPTNSKFSSCGTRIGEFAITKTLVP